MCLSFCSLTLLGVNAVRWYNDLAVLNRFEPPIPIDAYLQSAADNFAQNGICFGIMLLGVLIPTIINAAIFISSGIVRLVPSKLRNRYADECERTELSRLDMDRLAWKVSTMDSLAGVIFFRTALASLGYLIAWLSPAIGEVLYFLAQVRLFN